MEVGSLNSFTLVLIAAKAFTFAMRLTIVKGQYEVCTHTLVTEKLVPFMLEMH